MPDEIRIRDLMLTAFPRIHSDQTLGDAMAALLEAQKQEATPTALMVVDTEGRFVGMLTPKLLNKSLLASWTPTDSAEVDEERRVFRMRRRDLEVVANLGDAAYDADCGAGTLHFGTGADVSLVGGVLHLPPHAAALVGP